MHWIESFWVAVSTYSVLPAPQLRWTERSTQYALCFFPAVGLLCGGVLLGWSRLCRFLDVQALLFACGAVCLPLLLTGGIHMDGYMDTVDALASHRSREEKLAILKDPHCGAFAVIYCGVYLVASLGLYYAVYLRGTAGALCPAFVLSRALSALCALTMPSARKSGMLGAFTQQRRSRAPAWAMAIVALLAAGAMAAIVPGPGILAAAGGGLGAALSRRMAMRQFGGATGDTAGFLLQISELGALLGCWIGGVVWPG